MSLKKRKRKLVTNMASDDLIVHLQKSFLEYYKEIERHVKQIEGIEYDDDTLCIKYGVDENSTCN